MKAMTEATQTVVEDEEAPAEGEGQEKPNGVEATEGGVVQKVGDEAPANIADTSK
jgi:hypothetical protein